VAEHPDSDTLARGQTRQIAEIASGNTEASQIHPEAALAYRLPRWLATATRRVRIRQDRAVYAAGALVDAVRCETAAICCTIATPSTPSPSERSLRQGGSNRWCCLPAART
jgi:hypothetical protein